MARHIHLIGPGGAGKTAAGRLLAERLGCTFLDLDQLFMARHGDIVSYMAARGYEGYARANVTVYEEAMTTSLGPAVIALSSGFMTYPPSIGAGYPALRGFIERHPLTVLLLPSFDTDECCRLIVERQLARPYLRGERAAEEARIRARFPVFMSLTCQRVLSRGEPAAVAVQLEQILSRCCI